MAFRNTQTLRWLITLDDGMRHQAFALLVVLSAVFGVARTASDKDTARAIQGARQLHDSVSNPDSLQVSRALVTGSNICIDYRSRNGAGAMNIGVAVYEADKNLLFVDNSWVWQRACLFGKYAQRREGADVTEAMSDALRRSTARSLKRKDEPSARPAPPAVSAANSAPNTYTVVAPTAIVTTATDEPVSTAPPELPRRVAKAPAATAASDALKTQPAPALNAHEEPRVPPAPPAVSTASSAPGTYTAVKPTAIVTTTTEPVTTAPPELARRVATAPAATAVSDAPKTQPAPALNANEEPRVQPAPPAVSAARSAPGTYTAVKPKAIVTTTTAQPVSTAPAELPLPVATAPAATAVEARTAAAPVGGPAVPTQPVEPPAPPRSSTVGTASVTVATAVAAPQPAAAAPVETHLPGAVIIGPDPTAAGSRRPAAPESLGDAARRLRNEKLRRQPGQVP